MNTPLDTSLPELIVARPDPRGWCLAGQFGLLGGLCWWLLAQSAPAAAEPVARDLLIALLAGPFLLVVAGCALWIARARVIADAVGLRWRSIGRWRSAAWNEVTDYYEQGLPGKNSRRLLVETRAGRLALSRDLDQWEALRDVVAARALRARARGWSEKGTRPEDDWPRVFSYDTVDSRLLPALLVVFLGAAIWGAVCLAIPETVELARDLGWPLALTAGSLLALLFVGAPLACIGVLLPVLADTRRRQAQTLTADLEGLRFRGPEGELAVRWEEVREYFDAPATGWIKGSGPAVVITARGHFSFRHTIRNAVQLRTIIQRYATSAGTKEWRGPAAERLGDEAACWTGRSVGVGQRVFHYRTRTNRALLAFAGAHWFALVLSAAIGPLHEHLASEPGWVLGPSALLSVGMLWLLWRYRSAAILLDERGITQRAWNGDRFLAWADVEAISTSGSETFQFGNVVGRGNRLRFWLTISDLEELLDTISLRAPAAHRSSWRASGPE